MVTITLRHGGKPEKVQLRGKKVWPVGKSVTKQKGEVKRGKVLPIRKGVANQERCGKAGKVVADCGKMGLNGKGGNMGKCTVWLRGKGVTRLELLAKWGKVGAKWEKVWLSGTRCIEVGKDVAEGRKEWQIRKRREGVP
jgi:hypothetical protein